MSATRTTGGYYAPSAWWALRLLRATNVFKDSPLGTKALAAQCPQAGALLIAIAVKPPKVNSARSRAMAISFFQWGATLRTATAPKLARKSLSLLGQHGH